MAVLSHGSSAGFGCAAAGGGYGPAWERRRAVPPAPTSPIDSHTLLAGDHCDIREWVLYHATIGVGKMCAGACTLRTFTEHQARMCNQWDGSGSAEQWGACLSLVTHRATPTCASAAASTACCAAPAAPPHTCCSYMFDTGSVPPMDEVLTDVIASGRGGVGGGRVGVCLTDGAAVTG